MRKSGGPKAWNLGGGGCGPPGPRLCKYSNHFRSAAVYWWSERSERSHSQFMSIEICCICRVGLVRAINPWGGSYVVVMAGRLQIKRSRVQFPHWNFFFHSFSFFFFCLIFSFFLFLSHFSPFFFLHARSALSMLNHFSSYKLDLCKMHNNLGRATSSMQCSVCKPRNKETRN